MDKKIIDFSKITKKRESQKTPNSSIFDVLNKLVDEENKPEPEKPSETNPSTGKTEAKIINNGNHNTINIFEQKPIFYKTITTLFIITLFVAVFFSL